MSVLRHDASHNPRSTALQSLPSRVTPRELVIYKTKAALNPNFLRPRPIFLLPNEPSVGHDEPFVGSTNGPSVSTNHRLASSELPLVLSNHSLAQPMVGARSKTSKKR
jgi:hypothetical protein